MFDFPATPTVGQTYTSGGMTYIWNGTVWVTAPVGSLPFKRSIILASGNFTYDAATLFAEVILAAGGAGGWYCRTSAGTSMAGAGGGAGETAISTFTGIAGTTVAVVIGPGGVAGTGTAPVVPTAGGDSTWGATTMIAKGGDVGSGQISTTGTANSVGGAGGTGGTGQLLIRGGSAGPCMVISGSAAQHFPSNGGDSYLGGGGISAANGAGGAGVNGSGGGGVSGGASALRNGGAGGAGVAIVTEYR